MANRTWAWLLAVPVLFGVPNHPIEGAETSLASQSISSLAPRSQDALEPLLEHHRGRRYHKASEGYYNLLLKGMPRKDSTHTRLLLADCFYQIGFTVAGLGIYREALKLSTDLDGYESNLDRWADLVLDMPGAPLYGVQTVSSFPDRYDGIDSQKMRFLRGLDYMQAGDDGAAMIAFQDVSSTDWVGLQASFFEAVVYANQGLDDPAKSAFEGLLKDLALFDSPATHFKSLEARAHLNLARLAYGQGDFAQAQSHYQAADDLGFAAHTEMAWSQLAQGDADGALETVELQGESPEWPPEKALVISLAQLQKGDVAASDAAMVAFKADARQAQSAIRSLRRKYSRRKADQLALAVLELPPFGTDPEAEGLELVETGLPPAFAAKLMTDWRIQGAKAYYELAQGEMAWYGKQLSWWKETEVGKLVPQLVDKNMEQMLRQTGLRLLSLLEAEEAALDQLIINGVLAKKEAQEGE